MLVMMMTMAMMMAGLCRGRGKGTGNGQDGDKGERATGNLLHGKLQFWDLMLDLTLPLARLGEAGKARG